MKYELSLCVSGIMVFSVLFFPAVLLAATGGNGPSNLVLADAGKSSYIIVTPQDPTPSEAYAAQEFQRFIKEISGAELFIAGYPDIPDSKRVLIGRGALVDGCLTYQELADLGPEGVILRTCGHDLALAGSEIRGGLYAVYTFLQDKLGCRWFTTEVSRIPKMDRIEIGPLDEKQMPAFEYREPFFSEAFNGDWAARNRSNGNSLRLEEKHGGAIRYDGFVHTLYRYIPPDQYLDQHPEYYSEIDGDHRKGQGQPCLTNPDVLRIVTENVLKAIEADPGAKIFSVSQMDNMSNCKTEESKRIYEEEGSPAGELIRFVNAVADEVAKKFPDVYIDTLAYQYTENAPKVTKPRPNVVVRLCHMAPSCDIHPLRRDIWNMNYVKNLKAWRKITDKVYIWHYVTDFAHYVMPFPDLDAIKADIPFYHEIGVDGIFAQGSYTSFGGDMAALKSYLIARLLWDPGIDADAVIDEFLDGVYGPAAPPIRQYIKELHDYARSPARHGHLYSAPNTGFLGPEVMRHAVELFDQAMKLAAGDEAIPQRVRMARLPILYVQVTTPEFFGWSKQEMRPGGPQDQYARLERFIAEAKDLGVTSLREGEPIDAAPERLKKEIEHLLTFDLKNNKP